MQLFTGLRFEVEQASCGLCYSWATCYLWFCDSWDCILSL